MPTLKKSGSGSGVGLAGGLRSVLWGEPITIKEESHSGPIKDYDIPLSLYEDDVFQYLICQEQKSRVSPNYFIHQTDLTERMRKIMVDWLIKVHLTFNLMPESLYLAVQLMDRYLTSKVIHRSSYQLVGMACLLISAKMEDVAPPQIEDFLVLTENGFSRDEIVKTEFDILVTLEFECSVPTPYHFMRIYLGDLYNTDDSFEYLCNYLIESSLMEISLHNYAPSLISAGALYLARKMYLDEPAWNLKLEEITTYNEEFSKECAVNICIFLRKLIRSTTLKGLIKKYSLDEFKEVSLIPLPSDLYHH
uniref:Uncharacterized protein n=1 Tax=Arcella intermedia TaxID=1963864 RepID=A0A6B2L8Z6_9EUKA